MNDLHQTLEEAEVYGADEYGLESVPEEGYTYDTVIVEIGNANYPHSIIRSSDPVTLSHGQIKTYRIGLIQDD